MYCTHCLLHDHNFGCWGIKEKWEKGFLEDSGWIFGQILVDFQTGDYRVST